jgi:hypothetical protein
MFWKMFPSSGEFGGRSFAYVTHHHINLMQIHICCKKYNNKNQTGENVKQTN